MAGRGVEGATVGQRDVLGAQWIGGAPLGVPHRIIEQPGEVTGLAERDEPPERNATKLRISKIIS